MTENNETESSTDGGTDEEETSEEVSAVDTIDHKAIKTKFSNLATALQETNQNLVTFEYLLEHYRSSAPPDQGQGERKAPPPESSQQNQEAKSDIDIVDLLKDICGSVNELKSEMGQGQNNIQQIESSLQYSQRLEDLSGKCSKLEVDSQLHKSKCLSMEEKYFEEKRRNAKLDEMIREQENEIRKLNMYLKESDDYSKEIQQECHYLKQELLDSQQQLKKEKLMTGSLNKDIEDMKRDQSELKVEIESERKVKEETKQDLENCKKQMHNLKVEFERKLENEIALKDNISNQLERNKKQMDELKALHEGTTDSVENKDVDEHCSDLDLDLETQGNTARSTTSSKSEVTDDGKEKKLKDLRESRNRLKQKTKLLLKQYRNKRSLLEKKDRQLTAQRTGLLRLQTLHQSVESNHYIVIHHLGQQIIQIAKLVATLWPAENNSIFQQLHQEKQDKLSEWILYIDTLSSWTINRLVNISMVTKRDVQKQQKIKLCFQEEEEDVQSANKHSIIEAAKNCESDIFDEMQRKLISNLEDEKTEVDTSIGTWM